MRDYLLYDPRTAKTYPVSEISDEALGELLNAGFEPNGTVARPALQDRLDLERFIRSKRLR